MTDQLLRQLMQQLPDEPSELIHKARQLRQKFHDELARSVQPAVNALSNDHAPGCLEDDRDFVAKLNDQMRSLGLTFREPRTLKPARLVVDTSGPENGERTRFRYCVRSPSGNWTNINSSYNVPVLDVIAAPAREENLSRSVRSRNIDGKGRG
jgi:hypothetical protein